MNTFAALAPTDERGEKEFNKNPQYLAGLDGYRKKFICARLSILIESDFGAVLYNDKLFFASARNERNKTYGWNNEPFWTSTNAHIY
jgi:hypothetical protein